MPTPIHDRIRLSREGRNPCLITRLESGWVVAGDSQVLPGYCLLLPDPVVKDLNALSEDARILYCRDMVRVGDALLKVTDAYRINYEILGNKDHALHAHITPRYLFEPEDKRTGPVSMGYDTRAARKFDPALDGPFVEAMRAELARFATAPGSG